MTLKVINLFFVNYFLNFFVGFPNKDYIHKFYKN